VALKPFLLLLAAIATLAACGSRADDPALGAARGVISGLLNRAAPDTAALPRPDLRSVFTREIINQATTPLLFVSNDVLGSEAILWRIGSNHGNETWRGEDEISLTLSDGGVLRSTRGFLFDLYAADIEGIRAALAGHRAGTAHRMMARVEGDLQDVRTPYTCEVGFASPVTLVIFGESRRLTPAIERCAQTHNGDAFENRYWIDSAGFSWVSEQWAGPELGHFRIERLYR